MASILIIGGGITGAAAAWSLAKHGHEVRLIEKRGIAAMASGWTLGGVRQSGRHPAELPLAKAAVDLWPRLSDLLGADTGHQQRGNLRLARNAEEAVRIRNMVAEQNALGLGLTFLEGADAVRAIAPAIAPSITAASFCPSDGFADPIAATSAFANAAQALGAQIGIGVSGLALVERGGRIIGAETSEGFIAADAVIVAAGVNTPHLLNSVSLHLPLTVTMVHVVQTEAAEPTFEQVFGVANADCAGRQEPNGRFRYTTGVRSFKGDAETWTKSALAPSPDETATLRARVGAVLPAVLDAPIAESWGGLIDLTPDALPVLSSPMPGLVVAAGFSGHGFCLGPISGQIAADLALTGTTSLPIRPFRLSRFDNVRPAQEALSLHG
jgi:sarcosine oxidase, subunit beta